MKISSGIIITDGDSVLGCIPFGKSKSTERYLDIPKGGIEEGEEPIDAAIRECQEETGITLSSSDLVYKGLYDYKSYKKLHIYLCQMPMPSMAELHCDAMIHLYGKDFPEMIGYKIVAIDDVEKYFYKDLSKIILEHV
jgi:8-oxo-dGTP pyrophosphatase MutT (NUDIX family)